MKLAGLASIAVLAGLAVAAPASWAADFTITVPVEATGLPAAVNKMQTSCQIFTNANMPVVGAGSTDTPITGRAFRGDVVVTINAQASVDPATATRYQCSVWFVAERAGAGGANIYYYQRETPDGAGFQNFPLLASAPFKLKTGTVPLPPR